MYTRHCHIWNYFLATSCNQNVFPPFHLPSAPKKNNRSLLHTNTMNELCQNFVCKHSPKSAKWSRYSETADSCNRVVRPLHHTMYYLIYRAIVDKSPRRIKKTIINGIVQEIIRFVHFASIWRPNSFESRSTSFGFVLCVAYSGNCVMIDERFCRKNVHGEFSWSSFLPELVHVRCNATSKIFGSKCIVRND